ncbi:MAG: NUDIX domain-containing protein [Ruminococcaceae bacterium]|nr:NUDIX domain-containing protein [Oscillospiraceae bacterium]
MITEKSCGAVVFTKENGCIRYLIIQSREGFYGFPKGHMESGETEVQTALREIAEETGLSVNIIDGFRTVDSHPFERDGETRMKHIVYFLAEYSNQIPAAQETELNGLHLMDYETAIAAFQFESSGRILTEAHTFLTQG